MARKYSNTSVTTTLVNSISASETSIQINDTGGLPSTFPYSLILDFEASTVEVVTVTNLAGGTLTVTRGQDGTAAQSHDAGAVVVHGATARDLSEPQLHIDETSNVHGLAGGAELVGTTSIQTLTNKTIAAGANTLSIALDDLSNVTVPSPVNGQLLAFSTALSAWQANGVLAPPDVQVFVAPGTWNKPSGARWVHARAWGAGAGGAGSDAADAGELSLGGGAGGGAYAESILDADAVGASESVTPGTGGTGGTPSGGGGTNSTFGAHVVADAGVGTANRITSGISLNVVSGSNGGFQNTGQIDMTGGSGGYALRLSGSVGVSGSGGACAAGAGERMGNTVGSNLGQPGVFPGGGGSGGRSANGGTARAGGDGSDGLVVVVTYF